MNAKKAKMLRRIARNATKDAPERRLVAKETGVGEVLPDGRAVPRVTAVNDIKTFRGINRYLKREAGAFRPVDKQKETTNG